MKETPFFFPNGSYNLFGILHEPEKIPNNQGFVFCHPFAEEKLWTHRVFVNFARELAKKGYTILRFDYMGHGDSEGDFENSTIETRLFDIKCAIKTLIGKISSLEKVGLIGLRLGATLASIVAEEKTDIFPLILWAPIINGRQYMREMLRINLSSQLAVHREIHQNSETLIQIMRNGDTVNLDGYEMAWPLYEQAKEIDLLNKEKRYIRKTLLLEINKKGGDFNKNIEQLRHAYQNCDLAMAIEEPFWKEIRFYYSKAENLFHITLEWLRKI